MALETVRSKSQEQKQLIDSFHKLFYQSLDWRNQLTYFGTPILKNPLDLFLLTELVTRLKPDVVIETGTAWGGSALYLAHLMDQIGKGVVVTVDNAKSIGQYIPKEYVWPTHSRIKYLVGDSTNDYTLTIVKKFIELDDVVMVILDSDHTYTHVMDEMQMYAPLVTPGAYMVVEDTNTDVVLDDFGPGASLAVDSFLETPLGKTFTVDQALATMFQFSFNTWLKRL